MHKFINILLWPLGMRLQKYEHLEPLGREITSIKLHQVSIMADGSHSIGFGFEDAPRRLFEVASWWELRVWRVLFIILTDKKISRRSLDDSMEHHNCRCTITDHIHPERNGEYLKTDEGFKFLG